MLLDSCAAVFVEESRCRIITASGAIVDVDGMLRLLWADSENEEIPVDDFMLLVQMVKGAKEWLLYLPELSCGGFRAFLNQARKKNFLVFPNGCAMVLKQEADNCWSLQVNVYLRADGSLRFVIAEGELYKLIQVPKFEKIRDVKRILGSTRATPSAIQESPNTVDCGDEGQMFASIMDFDDDLEGEEYIWLD